MDIERLTFNENGKYKVVGMNENNESEKIIECVNKLGKIEDILQDYKVTFRKLEYIIHNHKQLMHENYAVYKLNNQVEKYSDEVESENEILRKEIDEAIKETHLLGKALEYACSEVSYYEMAMDVENNRESETILDDCMNKAKECLEGNNE